MIPHINPDAFKLLIKDNFYILVNPSITNGIKIINTRQANILNVINGNISIKGISEKFNFPENEILKYLQSLVEKNIISFVGNDFKSPKWEKLPKSLDLWVHTTNECTLKCSYCYISTLHNKSSMNSAVIFQLEKRLVELIRKRSINSLKIRFAGGEPLLVLRKWKTFVDKVAQITSENHIRCKFVFLTNLTIFNSEIMDFIKKHKIGMGVSLDGLGVYHDRTRKFKDGSGSFFIIKNNLEILLKNGVVPYILTVVSNENLDGLVSLTKYLIGLDLPFRYSIVHGEEINRKKAIDVLSECYEILSIAIDNGFSIINKHKLCDLKPLNIFFQPCLAGISSGAINCDGDVYFCQTQFGKNEPLGNIYDDDLVALISKGKSYQYNVPDECKSCIYRFVCSSGCPLYREQGKDLNCELYRNILPKIYKLYGKERLLKIIKYYSQNT